MAKKKMRCTHQALYTMSFKNLFLHVNTNIISIYFSNIKRFVDFISTFTAKTCNICTGMKYMDQTAGTKSQKGKKKIYSRVLMYFSHFVLD